jgi:hypothetical protein
VIFFTLIKLYRFYDWPSHCSTSALINDNWIAYFLSCSCDRVKVDLMYKVGSKLSQR